MTSLQARKNELLVESAINREVLLLEAARLRQSAAWFKPEMFKGHWGLIAPAAGILLAWTLRRRPNLLAGCFSLVRKLWQAGQEARPSSAK